MSSSLRVNTIVPSTGTNVAIGTANGTVTFTDSVNFVLGTGSSIFSPASNTLTFGTNDAERLRIDSNGKIGINNTSPSSYYANQLVVDTGSAAQSGITIVGDSSNQGMIAFADGTSGADRYRGLIDYNHSTNKMTFGVNANTKMQLMSGGHFGASSSGNFYGDSGVDFHCFNQSLSGQWSLGVLN